MQTLFPALDGMKPGTKRLVLVIVRAALITCSLRVNQNYQEAYRQYQNSLDYFMLALKCQSIFIVVLLKLIIASQMRRMINSRLSFEIKLMNTSIVQRS